MRVAPTDVPMLKAVHDLELPDAEETAWGVPIMDTTRFHQVVDTPPTGFRGLDGIRPRVVVEWLDDETGGVVCMLKNPAEVDERYNRLPSAVNGGMVDSPYDAYNVRGMPPGVHDKEYIGYEATHLGFLVLANNADLIAVQYPGTHDYRTAYKHMNDDEEPGIVPNSRAYFPTGRRLLNIIAKGLWPRDHHFYIAHAPAFVIGGRLLVDELVELARNVPDNEVDRRGGFLDYYGNTNQVGYAIKRVKQFLKSDDPSVLYRMDYHELFIDNEQVPAGHTANAAMLARFNNYVAREIFGIELAMVSPN